MSDEDSNVVQLHVNPKPHPSAEERDCLVIVERSKCEHTHCTVDPELLELTCRDCAATLNPITFVVKIAEVWRLRGLEHRRRVQALEEQRKKLEERSRCRCEHCGKTMRIRRVSNRELARIRDPLPTDHSKVNQETSA
jgi:hypothetical protein